VPKTAWVAGALMIAGMVAAGLWFHPDAMRQRRTDRPPKPAPPAPITYFQLEPEARVFAQYAGSASCRDCHKEAYALWKTSNHGLAERLPDPARDREAFVPSRTFKHGTQSTEARERDGRFEIVADGLSNRAPLTVERVIGNDPLIQFLVPFPGGRWQTHEASFDPRKKEWFNVYGDEDRQPGEWGHWTGRGMNWNTMCAACHNTRLRKNYDEASDTYRTTMAEMSVGCEACHGPMKDHTDWQNAHKNQNKKDPTLKPLNRGQWLDTCAFCHSRRMDLTGDFKPGDRYLDHHSLIVVDETDIYHPDGQVRDENYEYTAFLGSKMSASGVLCMDCHNPHSMKTLLPGNLLCQRCHEGGHTNAPIIDPVKHSFHKVFNPFVDAAGQPVEVDLSATDFKNVKETGGQCVNCHMPQTVYMQRHWRHDHGFTVPDPLLTKQFGIPNACNRCHQKPEETVDWAIAYVDKWYGEKMNRPSRERTRWLARARQGEAAARDPLLRLMTAETNAYWRAVSANLLESWAHEPAVTAALLRQLADTNALVRGHVVQSLGRLAEQPSPAVEQALRAALADPVQSVRYHAAIALRAVLDPQSPVGRELLHTLDVNADQPVGQMQKGVYYLARKEPQRALAHFQKAAQWDAYSPGVRHELAIVHSLLGQTEEALKQMREAVRLAPREAEYHYKLALALNETGDVAGTVAALEEAVKLDPRHARAWYNLGLGRNAQGHTFPALEALARAETLEPSDPRIPYARATILAREKRYEEARVAAKKALGLNPHYREAQALLQALAAPPGP